jgi:hypothetical protein
MESRRSRGHSKANQQPSKGLCAGVAGDHAEDRPADNGLLCNEGASQPHRPESHFKLKEVQPSRLKIGGAVPEIRAEGRGRSSACSANRWKHVARDACGDACRARYGGLRSSGESQKLASISGVCSRRSAFPLLVLSLSTPRRRSWLAAIMARRPIGGVLTCPTSEPQELRSCCGRP